VEPLAQFFIQFRVDGIKSRKGQHFSAPEFPFRPQQ
jgi:hypothetical protein